MVPEEADDLWLAYNLISKGDKVLSGTVRYFLFSFCFSNNFVIFFVKIGFLLVGLLN